MLFPSNNKGITMKSLHPLRKKFLSEVDKFIASLLYQGVANWVRSLHLESTLKLIQDSII